jgi:hypothetical protein
MDHVTSLSSAEAAYTRPIHFRRFSTLNPDQSVFGQAKGALAARWLRVVA